MNKFLDSIADLWQHGACKMSIDERRQQIIHILQENGTISVNSLISMMEESPATIRRDLSFLEENGVIQRSRGYAKYIQPEVVHQIQISEEKVAVAQEAAKLIPEGATICLDSGVSALALAYQLTGRDDITVVTNSLSAANVFAASKVNTYMICGHLEGRQEAIVGPDAENYVKSMHFPILFLTTSGIRGSQGLVCVTPAQCNLKHAFIESSEKVILLTEAKKFEIDSVRMFASFDEIDVVIVERHIAPEIEAALKDKGVRLIVAGQ